MAELRPDGGDTARSLAVRVVDRLDQLTDVLVSVIGEQNPGYRLVDVVPRDDLWHSCHDNLRRVLQTAIKPRSWARWQKTNPLTALCCR